MFNIVERELIYVTLALLILGAGAVRSALISGVSLLAGAAAAIAAPANHAAGRLHGWLSQMAPQNQIGAVLQLALLAVCVVVTVADYQVLCDTLHVVWPAEISPRPLALGIVLLTGALGYLVHRSNRGWARMAVFVVMLVLALAQSALAWQRAKEITEVEEMLRHASVPEISRGNVVVGGVQESPVPSLVAGLGATTLAGIRGIPALSALIAFFVAAAGALTAWGVAAYSQGEIVWVLCSPLFVLLLLTIACAEIIIGLRQPACDAIDGLFATIIGFRAKLAAGVRSIFPWTLEGAARRVRRMEREREIDRARLERNIATAEQRHQAELATARRQDEQNELEHQNIKREMERQADLRKRSAELNLQQPHMSNLAPATPDRTGVTSIPPISNERTERN